MRDLTTTKYNHEIFSNQCKNALDIAPSARQLFACRWRGEIVNGGIPDSLVMWDGFGALESGICPGGTGSWMGRRPC